MDFLELAKNRYSDMMPVMMLGLGYPNDRVDDIKNKTVEQLKALTGPHFLKNKEKILAALDHEIDHGDMDRLAAIRRSKRTL